MSPITQKTEIQKVIILGLDNSGKTCILVSLKDDTNLLSYFSLKPTKSINIERFNLENNIEMAIWDFGGQEHYREEYLKDFSKYADGVDKAIYVIDVQDIERYDLALKYLEEIINCLQEENIILEISIFLHKYDPNISKKEKFRNIDQLVKEKIIKQIKEIFPPEYKFKVFKSSIYTVFDKELVDIE